MKTHKSISHLSGKEQNSLYCIKKIIVEHIRPLIIYCWNSQISYMLQRNCFNAQKIVEDWDFNCDLLVITTADTVVDKAVLQETEALTAPFGRVKLRIHPVDFITQCMQEGNLFFSWVHRNAIVLYERDNGLKQLPPPVPRRQEYQKQAESFYLNNPDMSNYLEEKLPAVENSTAEGQSKRSTVKPVEIRLVIEVSNEKGKSKTVSTLTP